MPKLNTSKPIEAVLNKDRRARISSRKVCRADDSPVKDSREDSLAFSGSSITSFGGGLRAGDGSGIGFEIQGFKQRVDGGVAFAIFHRVLEQRLREVQVGVDLNDFRLEAPQIARRERQTQHLHCRDDRADKQQSHQHCREGMFPHKYGMDFTDCPCGLSNLFFIQGGCFRPSGHGLLPGRVELSVR